MWNLLFQFPNFPFIRDIYIWASLSLTVAPTYPEKYKENII